MKGLAMSRMGRSLMLEGECRMCVHKGMLIVLTTY